MSEYNRKQARDRIRKALINLELDKNIADEIAFHMTDWKENLDAMLSIYEKSKDLDDDEIQKIVMIFLSHVPNHVAAAKKLLGLGPIEDIFNVGVHLEDEE